MTHDDVAARFMDCRSPTIGAGTVREWAKGLRTGSSVLELGCGAGVPITQVLVDAGLRVYGVDSSPRLLAAFRQRYPAACVECSPVELSKFFDRQFDAALAWGLIFLLAKDIQELVIRNVAAALKEGGKFAFTAPHQVCAWPDALTGAESLSLGFDEYRRILEQAGMELTETATDEGDNHYYFAERVLR